MRFIALGLVAALGVLSMSISPARADEEATWEVDKPSDTRVIRIHPTRPTIIELGSPYVGRRETRSMKIVVDVKSGSETMVLYAKPGAKPEELAGTLVVETRLNKFNLIVEPAKSPDEADSVITIVPLSEREIFDKAVKADTAREVAKSTAELTRRIQVLTRQREQLEQQQRELNAQHAKEVEELKQRNAELQRKIDVLTTENGELTARNDELQRTHDQEREKLRHQYLATIDVRADGRLLDEAAKARPVKVIPGKLGPARGPYIVDAQWKLMGSQPIFEYTFVNDDPRPFRLTGIQMLDEHRERDHAGTLKIDERKIYGKPEGVIQTIEPMARVRMSVLVDEFETVGEHMALVLSSTEVQRQVYVDEVPTWKLVEEPPPPDENEGKVTVSIMGTYGATWIDDATPITEELSVTDIRGMGMRVSYGLHKRFNFEAEAVYASTGEASFDGGLVRSAKLGRVALGGLLRLGSGRYVPVVRGLVGLQGASYDGVGDGFEFDLTWSVGGGLDIKAGPFVLGLTMSGGAQVQHTGSWFEGGGHLGFSWR